ncbi:hypothetical protein [Coleofasciculus sp. FACHB-1120]|uniref:glycosyltransferase n=1 Tax=Coleofasciculus sp. FACHB-1120 TaxID=2692783 RepID=UPI001683360F|nr:hypothetical protein [Coleofasciculus sp. FACHB-1120]MBD2744812.1 hypothetical protein [Coleofasciculus sp. FACHB-1120]
MTDKLPQIYFYIPQNDWPAGELPESINTYWQWQCSINGGRGIYNWTLQTYLHLKADGFPCELVGTIPSEGIVVAHRDSLPDNLQPGAKLLFVCILGDKGRHSYAQLHTVQNPREEMLLWPFWKSEYIRFWPQPGLLPRSDTRGDRFENIAFVGRERELASELLDSSWQEHLNALGLRWQIVSRDRWNDYSEIDAVLAVRDFNSQKDYSWKPASKLINAWHAGVPAILGRESAFRLERKSELDYIEINSLQEALAALQRLRNDAQLRRAMIGNGRIRSQESHPAKLVAQWRNFLTDVAVPDYNRWCRASNLARHTFLIRRDLDIKTQGMRSQIRRVKGQITGPLKSLVSQSRTSPSKS